MPSSEPRLTPLPSTPLEDPPLTTPEPNEEEPPAPDEYPFPRVVPQPIATPEQ